MPSMWLGMVAIRVRAPDSQQRSIQSARVVADECQICSNHRWRSRVALTNRGHNAHEIGNISDEFIEFFFLRAKKR